MNIYKIPIVSKRFSSNFSDTVLKEVQDCVDAEGIVITFNDGHRLKVKGSWYCNIHKIKESVNSERSILNLYYGNQLDDSLVLLTSEERNRIMRFTSRVNDYVILYADALHQIFHLNRRTFTRKDFALGPGKTMNSLWRQMHFHFWDAAETEKNDFQRAIEAKLKASLTNNQSYDMIRNEIYPTVVY